MIEYALQRFMLLINFISARGLQFVAPIVVANLLPSSIYGEIEFAHAAASLLANVIGLGLPALIPLALVRNDLRYPLKTLLTHQLWAAGALLAGATIFVSFGSSKWLITALFCAALVLQISWSYTLRSNGRTSTSLYLDAAPFALVALGSSIAWLMPRIESLIVISSILAGFVLILGYCIQRTLQNLKSSGTTRYTQCVRAGIPLMLAGLLSVLLATSARLGAGLLSDTRVTGELAAIARVTALPIIIHQLFTVAKFRELYGLPDAVLQRLLIRLCISVCISSVLLWCSLPWLAHWLGSAFAEAERAHPKATGVFIAQVIVWSGLAMNDLLATRAGVMSLILPWTFAATLSAMILVVLVLLNLNVDVLQIALAQTGMMIILFAAQSALMAYNGVRQTMYWFATLFATLFLIVAALLIS